MDPNLTLNISYVDTFNYAVTHQHIAICTVKSHMLTHLHIIFEFIQTATWTQYTLNMYASMLLHLYTNLPIYTYLQICTFLPLATMANKHNYTFPPNFFTHEQNFFTQSWIVRIVLNCISGAV